MELLGFTAHWASGDGDGDSYQYLVESIERYPSQKEFARMIGQAVFLLPAQGAGEEREGNEKCWEDLRNRDIR